MHIHASVADISSDERRHELATILARGVLRLRQRPRSAATPSAPAADSRRESAARGLEVPAKTVLSVSTRVNAPESLEP
ncbi:MAG: hypothetical protein DCC68_05190 [Planctomycetota bacterium]|nr:MAG: hypothetical protein DCC68_05190 [Planctomycetota bacterium]